MPDDFSKSTPAPDSVPPSKLTGRPPGFWNHLTPWTVLGLLLTAAWVAILVGIEHAETIPELNKLPAVAGALVVYVIIMASGARVAYKRCRCD